jgi:hypothetical protein
MTKKGSQKLKIKKRNKKIGCQKIKKKDKKN